ncbi:g-D-glutamyl-meso-diaminopimelate peptidase [Fontibacillus panacisegetis]|uniref:G-D-glutamyl-meso-diaminopimelate peptidase n=1 Tax=Fontibacillus panacisegetis TaxID=670482 RepID=A0A1G7MPY7_9BACL|nr:M14 family metallocarboxypeptidase [Fontibacillus panacisegetis]SDF63898.1 g-D-glutamyl-meso-diaminopimelate peptidase [Fontibacillus panacisegetis]
MEKKQNDVCRIIHLVDGGYRYSDYMVQSEGLLRTYACLNQIQIGESVLGKPIHAWVIGNGKELLHINAAVHANEWITAPLLLRFIEDLATEYGLIQKIEDKIALWVVPMVNPDGIDLVQNGIPNGCTDLEREQLLAWNDGNPDFSRWKANIRGVDLNDQFPAFWEEERGRRGRKGPAWQDYSGPHPLSEPEAIALADLTRKCNFSRVMSLHTQGREIYWNYRDMEPQQAEEIANQLANTGGYRAVRLSGSDAGYKDWFIQEFRRPGFTVEAGEGINPLPAEQFDKIYDELALIMDKFVRGN